MLQFHPSRPKIFCKYSKNSKMSAAARPLGNEWVVCTRELSKTPQRQHQSLIWKQSDFARLDAGLIFATQRPPSPCRLQRPTSSWYPTLCKDPKLSLSSNLRDISKRSLRMDVMCHSSLIDTSFSSCELCTTTYNDTNLSHMVSTLTRRQKDEEVGVQELTVYEVNQLDRGSPMLLSLSKLAVDWYNRFRVQPLGSLGDLVPFTNKIFDGSLKKRLGITAGIISVIRHYPEEDGLLFEAVYSFYFGDYGHISVKGAYKSHEDTVLTVTGGSGVFTGVYGTVQIHNVEYPIVLFYKFQLYGIPQLPHALTWDTIPPAKGLRPSHTASMPGFALPNFTD